jgi:molybdate transport system ATP-binding protein
MLRVMLEKQLPEFRLKIEFEIADGILVLFGPSGCGKTTILRCIAGLLKPDAGDVTLGNVKLYESASGIFIPPKDRGVGYVFQDYALFPHLNVMKNIMYGVKNHGKQAAEQFDELVRLLKITALKRRFPEELSGGEKQRVALARALMAEPRLLLLDEPLSALDSNTRLEIQEELLKIQKLWKIPFVLVTHDHSEAQKLGDSVLLMERGKMIG